ncbi:MAG: undecaprenyl/decaprenyl-phosphate alpha-N-acetylglucosaminyl 1-phosphate transferase [Deltaproteobacteria bacterium]|nr:undecaprenyl/decaprenyl-phosphate alpha-N-acetylglucosaminyl 1-phosphate transferase [Deltaproteobacteria bacterium]
MNHNLKFLILLLGVAIVSWIITRIAIILALKNDVVDHPRESRFHENVTPLLGGISFNLTFILGCIYFFPLHTVVLLFSSITGIFLVIRKKKVSLLLSSLIYMGLYTYLVLKFPAGKMNSSWLYLLGGGQIIFLTGLWDDGIRELDAKRKLLFQFVAALYFILPGQTVTFFPFPVNYMVTTFWIVSLTNAFNLIDGMNGLASGVAFLSAVFFGLISHYTGQTQLSWFCFIFGGAIAGYIPFNFPKARIFMGDSGSMFLGFILGSIAIFGTWRTNLPAISLSVPLMVLMYPLFDVALVMFNRIRERRSPFQGGNDHSHHRLVKMGLSPFDAVLFIYLVAFYNGFSAYFITMISYRSGLKMLFFTMAVMTLLGLRLSFVNGELKRQTKEFETVPTDRE